VTGREQLYLWVGRSVLLQGHLPELAADLVATLADLHRDQLPRHAMMLRQSGRRGAAQRCPRPQAGCWRQPPFNAAAYCTRAAGAIRRKVGINRFVVRSPALPLAIVDLAVDASIRGGAAGGSPRSTPALTSLTMMPVSKSARSLLVTDHTYILPMHTSERGARSIRDRARRHP
jgi:hypothetical protein